MFGPCVGQPKLVYARFEIGLRQPAGVFDDRTIADDLHDQVRGPFQFDVASRLTCRGGNQTGTAAIERLVRNKHNVRLGR